MDISALTRDSNAVQNGSWVSDIPGMGDLRLKVRGLTSEEAIMARGRKLRALGRHEKQKDGSPSVAAATRVQCEMLAEAVILDWDGLTENGEPLPFTRERAVAMLTNPDMMPFADAVTYAAQIVDSARADDQEHNQGN